VSFVRTDVSEVLRASFTKVTRIGELGTTYPYLTTDARYEEIRSEKGSYYGILVASYS
jgi:hypothetical protein